jgi:hypothetical protein
MEGWEQMPATWTGLSDKQGGVNQGYLLSSNVKDRQDGQCWMSGLYGVLVRGMTGVKGRVGGYGFHLRLLTSFKACSFFHLRLLTSFKIPQLAILS